MWPRVDAQVYTDASMSGWGAAWNGLVPVSGFFSAEHEGVHINELELLAALYALKHFVRYAQGRSVKIITESKVTEYIVRNMTSRSPRLLARLRELRTLCEKEGVSLSTRHLASVLNTWADRLYRRRDSHVWTLPQTCIRLLERPFSKPLGYRMATNFQAITDDFRHRLFYPDRLCYRCGPGTSPASIEVFWLLPIGGCKVGSNVQSAGAQEFITCPSCPRQ